uniref:Uncharacterized protein n=1 Tax=Knipowitschia caucasica TaxID=637954 RepID=A0AAV2LVC1_KNICA
MELYSECAQLRGRRKDTLIGAPASALAPLINYEQQREPNQRHWRQLQSASVRRGLAAGALMSGRSSHEARLPRCTAVLTGAPTSPSPPVPRRPQTRLCWYKVRKRLAFESGAEEVSACSGLGLGLGLRGNTEGPDLSSGSGTLRTGQKTYRKIKLLTNHTQFI